MQDKPVKTVSHFVSLGLLANVEFVLGCYAQGMAALGITHNLVVNTTTPGPAHPIAEESEKITSKFFSDLQVFKQLTINKVNVHIVQAHVQGSNLHFVIGYHEPY